MPNKMDKAEIEKLINDWFDNDRGSTGEKLNREELSSSITSLIIKWLESKKQSIILDSRTGKSVEFMEMGGRYETDEKAVNRNQLITELVKELND